MQKWQIKQEWARRKVLVLGEKITATIIAKQLAEENLEPVFLNQLLSRSSSNQKKWQDTPSIQSNLMDGWAVVQDILSQFALFSNKTGLLHPGVSDWADRPEVLNLAEQLGLQVLAPSSQILSLFGNQLKLCLDAARLSIPHLVFSFDPLHTLREIEVWMEQSQQQFPLILRTVQGGRGRHRVCVVRDHQSLQKDLPIWLEQLRRSFGEVIFFIEKYLETARLISIPFVRFQSGWCRLFSAIDSSLQRQQREVIEICPAEQVDAPILRQLESWTRKLVEEWSYVGVGILEFIVDGSRAYFSRGVAGLTMNFPLWEKISAVQAVAWQVEALKHSTPSSFRNFSEKRRIKPTICFGMLLYIRAEDPIYHLPQPGQLQQLSTVRSWEFSEFQAELAYNYEEGEMVEYFDSGDLGVVTLFSEKTHPLFDAAAVILKDISITGSLQTNIKFLEELVTHPWVRECIFHMHFIEEDFIPMTPPQLLRVKSSSDAREIVKQYLRALVSGRVYALLVRETGVSMISEHEILIWIESFGELVPHAISYSSRILHWRVEVGTRVTVGQELAEIEVYKGHRKR